MRIRLCRPATSDGEMLTFALERNLQSPDVPGGGVGTSGVQVVQQQPGGYTAR